MVSEVGCVNIGEMSSAKTQATVTGSPKEPRQVQTQMSKLIYKSFFVVQLLLSLVYWPTRERLKNGNSAILPPSRLCHPSASRLKSRGSKNGSEIAILMPHWHLANTNLYNEWRKHTQHNGFIVILGITFTFYRVATFLPVHGWCNSLYWVYRYGKK